MSTPTSNGPTYALPIHPVSRELDTLHTPGEIWMSCYCFKVEETVDMKRVALG
ncbi:hypothetical protein M378DRAFT_166531 [Amanita muscaria Koide BX008]|uniref:Uncharacterized protein n=1 Tax=Amanita muscaria (strain Koide BX008) TaxID=946122 RepID=A0A0C2SF99_AMAMK|nr:hypothetical protein M378DRAFT_166531 [Amanita muscaria Koide BX008]